MKTLVLGLFVCFSFIAFNSLAGVALHCENDGDGIVLCDAISTGSTNIKNISWAAVSPAVMIKNSASGASFACLPGGKEEGIIVLNYSSSNEYLGLATFSIDCSQKGIDTSICTVPPPPDAKSASQTKEAC